MLTAAGGSLVAISLRFQVEIYVASSKSSGSLSFLSPPQSPSTKIHRGLADSYLGQLSNGAEYGPAARARAEGSQCRSQFGARCQVARHRSTSFNRKRPNSPTGTSDIQRIHRAGFLPGSIRQEKMHRRFGSKCTTRGISRLCANARRQMSPLPSRPPHRKARPPR
jgi:hypothetical protein